MPTSHARWYSPTDGRAVGVPGADVEQPEVVVVGRSRGPQERGLPGDLQADLEAERLRVEVDLAVEPVHVEHGVVEAADWHGPPG